MYLGIDVGGTFTDGVIIKEQKVLRSCKVRTKEDLTATIEELLKLLLSEIATKEISRVVLSTTLITNQLARGEKEPIGLLLFPGPGMNPQTQQLAAVPQLLQGAVDYRGRLIEEVNWDEVKRAVSRLKKEGCRKLVVAAKFSQRNPELEEQVARQIRKDHPDLQILPSNRVSGLLNWIRRANGAVYTLTVSSAADRFTHEIGKITALYGMDCPLHLLKADGGTLPLDVSRHYPLETIFSGPAASALGALALAQPSTSCVVMDMGGTTTDMALILDGQPLLASRGAVIEGYPVPVRALAVSSLALGGDTSIVARDGKAALDRRRGPALCLGGPCLTLTDFLVYLGESELAKKEDIQEPLEELARLLGLTPIDLCRQVLELVTTELENRLAEMFKRWEEEPVYRVWQLLSPQRQHPRQLVCLGGPAPALGRLWSKKRDWKVLVPQHAAVANAVGAALAGTTLRLEVLIDTEEMTYSTNLGNIKGKLNRKIRNLEEARGFAGELFARAKADRQVEEERTEVLYEEEFNIVRGWHTTGRIYQLGLQNPPGIRHYIKEE